MEISFLSGAVTFICCVFTVAAAILTRRSKSARKNSREDSCSCACSRGSCGGGHFETTSFLNGESSSSSVFGGVEGEMVEKVPLAVAAEKLTGASMMEQLVPEITTHALSYLDYPSLCRLSMTNSLMRKAANDDNAWKALYHKDFTLEQDSLTPTNGWKAYYAATRAIMNVNADFFNIIKERSVPAMERFWLNADYVKCFHASGEYFTGACKGCGKMEIESGCNGEGRIQGGIATVPGFGWWPIKAYRPCPAFVASGGRYKRFGQSMDEVVSGKGGKVRSVGTDAEVQSSKKKNGTKS